MKNKRADIPIVILVLGILAICGFALLSFIVSEKIKVKPDELGLDVFEKLYSDFEKFKLYQNLGESAGLSDANKLGAIFTGNGELPADYYNQSQSKIVIKRYLPMN